MEKRRPQPPTNRPPLDFESLLRKHQALLAENKALKEENLSLKARLGLVEPLEPQNLPEMAQEREVQQDVTHPKPSFHTHAEAGPAEKIRLFMSLFKGRDDLYAKRWESSNGRSGYTPVCVNEWKPAFCRKTEVKCAVCGHRTYGVLDEKFIEAHLRGNLVAGIYPLRQDETCHFLAIDFDKDGWQQDVSTLGDVCTALAVPMAIERNRQTGETSGPVQNVGDLTQKSFIAEFGTGCRTFDGFGRNSWGVDIVGTHEQIKEGHKNLQAVPQPAQLSILPTISGSHPMFKACQLLGALVCSKVKCTAPGYMDKFGFECSSAVATWFATLTLMVERRTG